MKKLKTITALSLVTLLMASCGLQEPASGPRPDGESTTISAALATVQSKTWLDYASGGSPLKVYWSDGDKLNVNGQTSLPLSIGAGEEVVQADFLLSNLQAPYRAVYPSSAVTEDAYDANGSIAIQLPAVQKYHPTSFANGAAVMYGYSDTEDGMTLRNLCAVVRVNVKGSDDYVVAAKLVSSSDQAPLCGDFRLTPADGTLQSVKGNSTIVLQMDKVAMNAEAGTDFFFAIPAGDYSEGLSFYFKRESDAMTMQNIWRPDPDQTLEAGTIYSFNNIDFKATAKEICTPADWNEFAAAYNAGSDLTKFMFKDNVVRIGADISAEDLTSIVEFEGVLDGCGYTLTRTDAAEPLFTSITGEVRNLTLGGALIVENADESQIVACAPLAGSLDGGRISGCVNNMTVAVGTMENPVEAHMYVSGLVSKMTAGTIENSTNNASVDVSVNVNNDSLEVAVAGIVAEVRVSDSEQKISLSSCSNKGALTLAPYLTFKSASGTRNVGMKACGFGGVAGWLRSAAVYSFTDCDNSGVITLSASKITHAYGNSPFAAAVGGVLGFAAPNDEGWITDPANENFGTFDLTLIDCDNKGLVYNQGVNYSSRGEVKNKVYTGGLAGVLMGYDGNYAEVRSCTNEGTILTHDYVSGQAGVTPSARPNFCAVAGGLIGCGGYLDLDDVTVTCQIGNGKRQMAAWGGVIGYTFRPFNLKNSNVDVNGYFASYDGSDASRAAVAVVPVNDAAKKSDLVPDVSGSEISGNTIKCLLYTLGLGSDVGAKGAQKLDDLSSGAYVVKIGTDKDIADNLVCGEGFTANTGVTVGKDNTYL